MATFGGTFVDNSKKCHAAAFEKATGSTVKYVLGSSVQTMAKLRAAGARAEFDVAYMDSQIVKQAKAEGLLQPLEPAKIEHWNDLYDASRDKDALLGLDDVRGHHHHLQHQSREDAAHLVGRPLEAGVEGQARDSRHLGHLGPAVPDGGGAPQRRLGREHRPGLRGDQEAQAQRPDDVHAARPDHPALRARRHRARGVVHGPDRRGRPEGRAGGGRLPERGRDRHRADRLGAQGEPEAGARAEVHRRPSVAGGPALLRPERSSPGPTNKKVQLPADLAKLVPYGPLVQRMFFPDTDLVAKKFPEWSERWGREIAR